METVTGPDDHFIPPNWLMSAIQEVAGKPTATPMMPPVAFAMNETAASHNLQLLEKHNFDFEQFLSAHQRSTLSYGSKFRTVDQLRKILGSHPNFPELDRILSNGMDYRFRKEIPEAT
jgi:hypothetical protein